MFGNGGVHGREEHAGENATMKKVEKRHHSKRRASQAKSTPNAGRTIKRGERVTKALTKTPGDEEGGGKQR